MDTIKEMDIAEILQLVKKYELYNVVKDSVFKGKYMTLDRWKRLLHEKVHLKDKKNLVISVLCTKC